MLRPPFERTPSQVDAAIDLAVTIGVAILILVGFATSYRTLLDLAVTAGGYPRWLAPAVPLSFDLGVVVLSLKVAQSAREGRSRSRANTPCAGCSHLARPGAAGPRQCWDPSRATLIAWPSTQPRQRRAHRAAPVT